MCIDIYIYMHVKSKYISSKDELLTRLGFRKKEQKKKIRKGAQQPHLEKFRQGAQNCSLAQKSLGNEIRKVALSARILKKGNT